MGASLLHATWYTFHLCRTFGKISLRGAEGVSNSGTAPELLHLHELIL